MDGRGIQLFSGFLGGGPENKTGRFSEFVGVGRDLLRVRVSTAVVKDRGSAGWEGRGGGKSRCRRLSVKALFRGVVFARAASAPSR